MTTTLLIDHIAAGGRAPDPLEPCRGSAPSGPRFGEIGIAAVAGALAASRPNEAASCSTTQPLHRRRKGADADAAAESPSYELSNT